MIPTTVRVTEQHIADGQACEGTRCPIALALLDALHADGYDVNSVMVTENNVTAITRIGSDDWCKWRADLDTGGSDFVEAFDMAEDLRTSSHRDAIVPFELLLEWAVSR